MNTLSEQSVMPHKPILPLCICGDPQCCIPYGYCHCKCGSKTKLARSTNATDGIIRGLPQRYVFGHHNRLRPTIEAAPPFKLEGVYCRLIPLGNKFWTIVDESDYEWLMQWKWFAKKNRNGGYYVYRNMHVSKGKATIVAMHTVIANRSGKDEVDHADRCGLNNSRLNLRPCDSWQNRANRIANRKSVTGFKGVFLRPWKKHKRYEARIGFQRKTISLGYFVFSEEAARAYDRKAIELFGEFALLNFPKEREASSGRT